MEEILKQILSRLDSMEQGQKQLFDGQKQLFDGQKQLFDGQKQLFDEQKQLFGGQKQLNEEVKTIRQTMATKDDFKEIQTDLAELKHNVYGLETQLIETNSIARNIEHATATTAAQLDGMNITLAKTATKEDTNRLMTQHKLLNDRLFEQETEISILKAVK